MSTLIGEFKPVIAPGYRLQWEPAQSAHVLLYPEGMVKLNGSAGQIINRCNGERTVTEIVTDLERTYGMSDLSADVTSFVSFALEQRWLEVSQ
jgi:pyrroloquinoline quinone biosynthesis protein D